LPVTSSLHRPIIAYDCGNSDALSEGGKDRRE